MIPLTKLSARFTEVDIDNEIIIMRPDNGDFYALSGTAAAVWRLIDGKRDREALITSAAIAFEASEYEIASDVDELLSQLRDTGLLES